jgi:RimJ/RimL family protein N-acetyltransferase
VGSALWGHVAERLDRIGARRVLAEALDEPAAVGFASARGFIVTASTTILALDPRVLPAPSSPPPGVEVRSFRSLGDDLEAAYRADYETALDEPGDHDSAGMTYESWRGTTTQNPIFSMDASKVVVLGGEVVGVTLLFADELSRRALNGGTGVMRAHRGRGLATLMKRHALAEAARMGVTRVITQNENGNAAMLAINARLGYEPVATRLRLVRPAPGAS